MHDNPLHPARPAWYNIHTRSYRPDLPLGGPPPMKRDMDLCRRILLGLPVAGGQDTSLRNHRAKPPRTPSRLLLTSRRSTPSSTTAPATRLHSTESSGLRLSGPAP